MLGNRAAVTPILFNKGGNSAHNEKVGVLTSFLEREEREKPLPTTATAEEEHSRKRSKKKTAPPQSLKGPGVLRHEEKGPEEKKNPQKEERDTL